MTYRVLTEYRRRAHLEFYRANPRPFYSATFELDATRLRDAARDVGASTYAALCWAFHRALASIEAFRVRLVDEEVVLYDALRVGMTVPAPERLFTFATMEWQSDARVFLATAARTIADASTHVDLSGGAAPDFAYYTALPKVPFTSFTHAPLADPLAGQPETAFGKFRTAGDRTLVPIGVQVNHVYVDGTDLGDLVDAARDSFDRAF